MTRYSFLFNFLFLTIGLSAQTGTVRFQISNIQADQGGEISAGIFDEARFPKVGQQVKGIEKTVTGSSMELELRNVPPGTYGAVAFQDIDRNKDLKTNLVGYPREPIGFANGAKIRFGPPAFEDASIVVKAGETTIVPIQLN